MNVYSFVLGFVCAILADLVVSLVIRIAKRKALEKRINQLGGSIPLDDENVLSFLKGVENNDCNS